MRNESLVYARADSPLVGRFSAWRRYVSALAARRQDPGFVAQVTLALLFAGAFAAFAHVVEDYLTGDPIVRWDVEFSRWIHEHADATFVSVFKVVTWAGNAVFLAAVTIGVSLWLLRR